jgi:hypothetical protein
VRPILAGCNPATIVLRELECLLNSTLARIVFVGSKPLAKKLYTEPEDHSIPNVRADNGKFERESGNAL